VNDLRRRTNGTVKQVACCFRLKLPDLTCETE